MRRLGFVHPSLSAFADISRASGEPLLRAARLSRQASAHVDESLWPVFRRLSEQIQGNLQIGWTWTTGFKGRKRGAQVVSHIVRRERGPSYPRRAGGETTLVDQLVQDTPAFAEGGARGRARNDEQRHRIRVGLCHGGQNVGEPRTRYHECRGRLPAHARVAVGGKAGVLFVTYQDMADSRGCQSPVQFERVHAGDAKHRIDAVSREQLDDVAADCPSGGAHGVAIVAQRTHSRHMKFSPLVGRISGEGADAWVTHYDAKAARERGEDVIVLSVGDPDLEAPGAIVERAVERTA